MAAMIEELKRERNILTKENNSLRLSYEQLKRWIGKRAQELGLGKHLYDKDGQALEKVMAAAAAGLDSSGKPVLRGDPSLHSASDPVAVAIVTDQEQVKSRSSSPKSVGSPQPTSNGFWPVGFRTAGSHPLVPSPWLVEGPTIEEDRTLKIDMGEEEDLTGITAPQLVVDVPGGQPMQGPEDQQIMYLPKDTIIIVHGPDSQQHAMTGAPGLQQITLAGPPEVQASEISGSTGSTMVAVHGDVNGDLPAAETAKKNDGPGKENPTLVTALPFEPNEATAVESLLKLGYRIEKPKLVSAAPEAPGDHNYQANVITVPASAVDSASTVTVTTAQTASNTTTTTTSSSKPLVNGQFNGRRFGLVITSLPVGTA